VLNLDKLDARGICVHIKKNENNLTYQEKRELIHGALTKAKDSQDYLDIACTISHKNGVNDKEWSRSVFKKAYEITEDSWELEKLAFHISDKGLLNDQQWGKELFEKALKKVSEEDFDDIDTYIDIACDITDPNGLHDKDWAREIFERLLNKNLESSDIITIAQKIAEDSILGNKEWASKLIDEVSKNIQYGNDYLEIAFCLAHSTKINNKEEGREWFKKAVEFDSQFEDTDYFETAKIIANEYVLNDKDWAIELCMDSIGQTEDSSDILDIACFVEAIDKEKSIPIFKAALNKAKSATHLLNIACNIAESDKLNDKKWGKEVFEKALSMNPTGEEVQLINECINKFLLNT